MLPTESSPAIRIEGLRKKFGRSTALDGTQACNFPVRAPEYTTLNGAQATLTPAITGPGVPDFTGAR